MSSNTGHDDRFTINAKDLLQTNATILAGVLILLSIAASLESSVGFFAVVVPLGIAPFLVSSTFLLALDSIPRDRALRLAKQTTLVGLYCLAIAISAGLFFILMY